VEAARIEEPRRNAVLGKGAVSAVSSLSGVWGQVTAEIHLGTFSTLSKHPLKAISVQNGTLLVPCATSGTVRPIIQILGRSNTQSFP